MATTQDPKTVAFVLYPGITLLDMVGPLQVFSVLRGFNDQYQPVVVAERIEPMPAHHQGHGRPGAPRLPAPGRRHGVGGRLGLHRGDDPGRRRTAGGPQRHHSLVRPQTAGAPGRHLPPRAVGGGRQADHLGRGVGRDRHGPALVARLTDEPTARMVQLWIEYDPHPPFGGIDWAQVDRDMAEPQVAQWVRTQLADRPELLAKLTG